MKKTIAKVIVLAAISSTFALSGCRLGDDTKRIENDLLGYFDENTTALCSDGLDNDGDTLIDCMDPGCLGKVLPESPGNTVCYNEDGVLKEGPNEYTCSDGIDNDDNSYTDCSDNSCKTTLFCCPAPSEENSLAACSDGRDNDCDGYTDCASYTCTRANRGASQEAIDYCLQQKCPNGTEPENSLEACSDGVDNDCDGYKDCESFTCTQVARGASEEAIEWCNRDKTPVDENTEEKCSDNLDDNQNGLMDCDDSECKAFAYCQNLIPEIADRPKNFDKMTPLERAAILEREKMLCTDGFDNNHNGLVDCNEYSCMLRAQEKLREGEEIYLFNCPVENKPELCVDLRDNDHNHKIDCLDPNCKTYDVCKNLPKEIDKRPDSYSAELKLTISDDEDFPTDEGIIEKYKNPLEERYALVLQEYSLCTDGIDNNHNGIVDCGEPRCLERSYENIEDWKNNNQVSIYSNIAGVQSLVTKKSIMTPEDIQKWAQTLTFTCPVENTPERCADSFDDDYDGLTDCDDPKCHFKCELKADGTKVDPDCIDITYCDDVTTKEIPDRPENFATMTPEERAVILDMERTLCTDRIDNDKNGKKDCQVEECVRRSYEILEGNEAQYMFDYKVPTATGIGFEFGCAL